jgi:hypothetical protein
MPSCANPYLPCLALLALKETAHSATAIPAEKPAAKNKNSRAFS